MKLDPFTLRVALDKKGSARGELYLDDGETFSHRNGQIVWREFIADKPDKKAKTLRISSHDLGNKKPSEAVDGVTLKSFGSSNQFAEILESVRVERVVILGLSSKPKSVNVEGGQELEFEYNAGVAAGGKKEGEASTLTIKNPDVAISKDWAIVIEI
jgi:alpha 1,3-glucosidase